MFKLFAMNSSKLPILAALFLTAAPLAHAAGSGALERAFIKVDLNEDGFLSRTEFLALQSARTRWTDAMHRFELADVKLDDRLDLVEFRASNGGKDGGKPGKLDTFLLADLDESNSLDPDEFKLTEPQGKPWRKVLRDFGRKDSNDDILLGRLEFVGFGPVLPPL